MVGGGPTGVETAGALAELMAALARHRGASTDPGRSPSSIAGDALLGAFSDKSHTYALAKLTRAGAVARLGVGVTAVHADRVELDDGTTLLDADRRVGWRRVGLGGGAGGRPGARAAAADWTCGPT